MAMDSGIRRGIAARMVELDASIPDDWQQVLIGHRDMPLHLGWWASFDPAGRPLISKYGSLIYGVEDLLSAVDSNCRIFGEAMHSGPSVSYRGGYAMETMDLGGLPIVANSLGSRGVVLAFIAAIGCYVRGFALLAGPLHDLTKKKLLSMKQAIANEVINEGRLLNLISNDTQKLVDAGGNFHFAWFSLVEIFVVSGFIIAEAGVSGVPGVVLVLLCQPIPIWMSCLVGRLRLRAIRYTDERVRLVGELIAGIKTVKLNGWTGSFLHLIAKIRNKEVHWIKRGLCLKFLILTLKDSVVPLASMSIFWTYARLFGHLTASMSFSVLALLGILARVFNFAPTGIQYAGEAVAAVQRLQHFLSIPVVGQQSEKDKVSIVQPETSIFVSKVSFSWGMPERRGEKFPSVMASSGSLAPVLKDINFNVQRGQLIGITGPVGSGKSSLLLSLMGDTNRILAACGLDYDISRLPASDYTEIGDRGLNLSGGQKARIGLARACYSCAPVVLLDDPFAAVDAVTTSHIVQHVLRGILQGRTIVLTTQDLNVLDYCDEIFMVHAGVLQSIDRKRPVLDALKSNWPESVKQSAKDGASSISMHHSLQEQWLATLIKLQNCTAADHSVAEKLDNSSLYSQLEIKAPNSLSEQNNLNKVDCNRLIDVSYRDGTPFSLINESEAHSQSEDLQNCIYNKSRGALIVKEDRVEGRVTWTTLKTYLRACGYSTFVLVIGMFLLTQAARVMLTYWLAIWTDGIYHFKLELYAGIYVCIILGATLFSATRAYGFSHVTSVAANTLHKTMAKGVFNSPLSFFEQNLSGRLLNRFSKDQACIDEMLPNTAQSMLENIMGSIGSIAIIAVLVPWFLLALPPFVGVLLYFQRHYTAVSRELKRLDGISRSPISGHFIETLQGLTTIRAYGAEETIHTRLANLLDGNNSANILFQHVSRWLSFRLDLAAAVCVTVTALLVVLLQDHIAPGIAGVILVQSLQLTGLFQYGVRMAADTENNFTSVERVCAFADLEQEGHLGSPFELVSDDWPSLGGILFLNYTMAYKEDLAPVLNKVTLKVRPKEKVGIVGRTGAGKSSLVHALFRLVDNSGCTGSICIDGIDIKSVGLDDLRQRLSIVPQDPVLFKETLRVNLDPFTRHTDSEIFEALKAVHLVSKIQSLDKGLYAVAGGGGASFSVGECQLLCLARAILRRSCILVLDEATSAIDKDVDTMIQLVLREHFQSSTILSIAHRASTLQHCDRFLLLSADGGIVELGDPQALQEH
ncbi:hypothetical protein L7F22_036101 [Adiantum nelumboides]|nr:hypothetical protein [Adiantum nelumboides]